MRIRTATPADAAALAAVEAACFPPAEAATAAEIADRLAHYAGHFWILEEDDGAEVEAEAPAQKVCPICGAASDSKFCPQCGAPMGD